MLQIEGLRKKQNDRKKDRDRDLVQSVLWHVIACYDMLLCERAIIWYIDYCVVYNCNTSVVSSIKTKKLYMYINNKYELNKCTCY